MLGHAAFILRYRLHAVVESLLIERCRLTPVAAAPGIASMLGGEAHMGKVIWETDFGLWSRSCLSKLPMVPMEPQGPI